MNHKEVRVSQMTYNFWKQYDEAELKFAKQYLKIQNFLSTHPKSRIVQEDICIHSDDKEDFIKVMYGDIII